MFKLRPEILVILLFNIVPIIGVAYYRWAPFEVFWLFWMETLIIAVFNSIRVLYSQGLDGDAPVRERKLQLNYGSAIKYLLVRIFIFFFYSLFIIVFIGIGSSSSKDGVRSLSVIIFADRLFNLALLITILSQSYYLVKYFFVNRAYYFSRPGQYSALFDARQVVIHVAVVLGAVGASFLFERDNHHTAIWIIAVFCVVKCIVELWLASVDKTTVATQAREPV